MAKTGNKLANLLAQEIGIKFVIMDALYVKNLESNLTPKELIFSGY